MTAINETEMKALFEEHGCGDFRFIDAANILTGHWVRMKCRIGCEDYGKLMMCPPNLPSVQECRDFLAEYRKAAIFHFSGVLPDAEERHEWSRTVNKKLSGLEREVFLSGYYRAFMMFIGPCDLCGECVGSCGECRNCRVARPSGEGMCVDVFATARKAGYEINVLQDYSDRINRYAFLLIE